MATPATAPRLTESHLFWIVAVLVLGAGLGLRDPWPADEPRFALVARQMVESGQWLFPMRGDELYPDKPPLFMWLQAACYALLDNLRLAFLLPSLLSALATLWLVRDLGRRLWSSEAGAYAAWALLFALQFTFQARRAQIDPLVTFCITLSMYALLRHLLRGPDLRLWTLGWCAAGLGIISKGVGVIALLVLLPAGWASLRGWSGVTPQGWGRVSTWLGPLALLLPLGLWLGPMMWTVQHSGDPALQAYADNILLKQTARRYSNAWHHHQPWWYFFQVMATQWLPAMLAVPWIVPRWRQALRQRDARVLLPLAWVMLVLLFFTLSSGKREVYILPALPMLCLAMGPWLPEVIARAWPRRCAFAMAALLAGVLTIGGAMVWFGSPGFEDKLARVRDAGGNADDIGALLIAIGVFGLAALAWWRVRGAVPALLTTLGALWVGVGLLGQPMVNEASSARGLMHRVGQNIGPGAELGLVAWKEQNLLMADRPAATFGFLRPVREQLRDALVWQRQSSAVRWLLVERQALDRCIDRGRATLAGLANRREWWLVPGPATAACFDATGQVRVLVDSSPSE